MGCSSAQKRLISFFMALFCCCFLRPSQAPAHNLIRAPSPYTQLIQAAERHHQELSQLAGDHLARSQFTGVFPPIVPREESDPQLSMEGGKGSQSILNRWNSEGYLHQREKHKARKEKENSKVSWENFIFHAL